MKFALLVALATVATVASFRPTVHSVVYKPGEQYVYHYKGHILNGIPKSSKQFSGLLIDSLVLLQFQQDYKVVMKMENIKLYKIDNKISNSPADELSETDMTRLTGEQEKMIVEKLILPLKFRYEEGEVRELQKETRDKYWSVNIKKGILSIFQVTLKEKHSLSSESSIYYDPTMSRIKSYGSRSYGSSSSSSSWKPTPKTNSVFTVKETDVSGNCETKYTVVTDKTQLPGTSSTMYVTAVRNFENCHTRPFHIEGLFQGTRTSSAEKEIVQPTVHTDYIITGDRTHFMIKEATCRGKYFVFVNGLEGGDLSTYVHQKLTLKQAEPIRTPVHLVSPKVDSRGLEMIIPKSNLVENKDHQERQERHYDSYLYKKRVQQEYELSKVYESDEFYQEESDSGEENDIIPVADEKMKKLTQCMYSQTTEKKCSDYLMEVTVLLREATKEQLKSIYSRYVRDQRYSSNDDVNYRVSELLLDILPTMSNPDAAKILVELIRDNHISNLKGSLLMNQMSLIVKPTPTVIKTVLELFKTLPKDTTETKITGKTLLNQASLLAVGTLSHRLLVVMRSQGKPVPEVINFINNLCQEMKRMLEETQNESEKVLILKAMGNMGASENIITLKNIVEDRRETLTVRVNAVIALRRLAKEFKKQVIPVLMGVFMDLKEETELRQVAFLVIIRANPSYTTLQMIAHRINNEKCGQLRTLVYSNLINMAYYTSHQPEHKNLIKDARLVLKTIKPVHVGFYDSMTVFVNQFSEDLDMGVAFELTKIKSKESGIPQAITAALQGTLLGKHRNLMEVGAEGKAIQGLLKKVFGPHGILSQLLKGKVSLEEALKPLSLSHLGGVEHKIVEIMNKMRMVLPGDEELYANYFIHLLGNELQYVQLNINNIKELGNTLTNIITNLFEKLTTGTTFDLIKAGTHKASLTVATTMGIPLHLNHTIYGVLKVEGSVKVNKIPTDFSSLWHTYKRLNFPTSWDEIRQLPIDKIIPEVDLDLDIKPVLDVSQYITFGSDMRWLTTGVGVEGYLKINNPVRLNAEISKPKHSISVKYFPVKETTPIMHARVVPILFVNYIPTSVHRLPYTAEVQEIKNEEIIKQTPFNWRYDSTVSGLQIEMKGMYSLCGPTWCPIMPFFGRQEILVISKPANNVDFIELKLQTLKSTFEWEGIPSHLPTEELYEELEQQYESVNYRNARRSVVVGEGFEPVTVDEIFQGEVPIKRQLRLTIKPNNPQVPALMSQLTWFMSRSLWKNQFNFQIMRDVHHDLPQFKIIFNTVADLKSFYPDESYRALEDKYLAKSTLIWMINENKQMLKLKVISGSEFDFTEELRRQRLWPVDDLPEAKRQAHKYTVELVYPQLNHPTMKLLMLIDDAIKYVFYDKLTSEIPRESTTNKLIAAIEILPWWEKMHMIVKSPRENIYIANVPFYWNPFMPTDQRIKSHNFYAGHFYKPSFYEHSLTQYQEYEDVPYRYTELLTKGECKVDFSNQFVNTFDGVKYSIKPTLLKLAKEGCGLLTAQDCSKQGLFSLNLKSYSEKSYVAKLHLPQADIEIQQLQNLFRVSVNGQTVSLRPSQIFSIPSQIQSSSILHEIELVSSEEIVIKAKELGLVVRLDKNEGSAYVHISHGSMLWGNICGLCGNNNQDPSDDLVVPRSLRVPSSRPFYMSHLIPTDTCNLDVPLDRDDYCKKTAEVTVRRYDNEQALTCTTESKIVQCAEGCKPVKTRSVKTCFRCLTESGRTESRRSYYQPPAVWDVQDSGITCEEFSERLEVPVTCEPLF